MSTNDVPGANPSNNDVLAMGCWAEHDDGSLVLVESTEGNRAIYSVFDMKKDPIVEYRDAMPETNFKREFSWRPGDKASVKWTWHDKTPFPWDRVIKAGPDRDGLRFASVDGLKTAAERVAERLQLRASEFDEDRHEHMRDQELSRTGAILSKLEDALRNLPGQIATAISGVTPRPKGPKKKR